jgi:hypothetical protein
MTYTDSQQNNIMPFESLCHMVYEQEDMDELFTIAFTIDNRIIKAEALMKALRLSGIKERDIRYAVVKDMCNEGLI